MRVLVTGGTGHIGSYVIPELIAAGHEVTGLARSDTAAAAVSALGAKVRRGDVSDLDGLKAAAAESDGVIHLAHRQDLLPTGGIDAVAAAELQIMLAYGEALAGTGKPLVAAGSIGSPGWENLGRPATEEDPALPGGDAYKGTLRVRNIVEITVVGLAKRGVRSSIVRIPPIAHSTTDSAGFLPLADRARQGEGRHRLPRRRREPVAGRAQPRPRLFVPPGAGEGSGWQILARD
jgi:nucleoside-diphosphate-sugar epimerase